MALDVTKMRGMTLVELTKEEGELREEIWKLRLQQSTGQLQDTRKIRRKRHDLARVLTVRRELSSAAVEGR
jgi:large subunit ribosomal protein L29